jgi:hypothetical protein
MNPHLPARVIRWLPATALSLLAACHAASTRTPATDRAPAPKPGVSEDASYDWHALLIAPFGSTLKAVPLNVHEVLLFRDEAPGAAEPNDAECYAPDEAAPHFMGRTPDEYLLCFKQDRLSRIQASVRLDAAHAPETFTAACADWLQRATQASIPAPDACEGREGAVRLSARLSGEPETILSIVLDSVPGP